MIFLERKMWVMLFGLILVALFSFSFCEVAWASTTAHAFPWENALTKIKESLTGAVAMSIAIVALFAAGVGLIFGGEFSDFTRKAIVLAFVVGFLVSASTIVTKLFGTGALIA